MKDMISFLGASQLGIFLHCIFTISWLISTFSILFTFSNCFLQFFNHSACWLCSFLKLQISIQNLILSSQLRISLPPCFSLFRYLLTCFWFKWNSWFCLNCEILCSYLLTSVFFAIKKKLYGPFLWMGFNCNKARATSRRQFTFNH